MKIRSAKAEDLEALSQLVNSAYRGESSKKGWTTEEHLLGGQRTDPRSLAETIAGSESVILLLFSDDERLIGCVNLQKKKNAAYLGMLTIEPTLQAGGIGRKLLEMSEQWAKENWQIRSVEMNVISVRQELIAWYERRGYQRTGRREPFPYGDERFGLPKVDGLEFIVLEKSL